MDKCQACHGTGKLTGRIGEAEHVYPLLPCDVCGGCSWEHCCDGDRAQPEPQKADGDG
jgi:hypothetical protein